MRFFVRIIVQYYGESTNRVVGGFGGGNAHCLLPFQAEGVGLKSSIIFCRLSKQRRISLVGGPLF
ncbi:MULTISPECIES: hypothetical protein [unclassified Sphingomonas]|uniref:hypothetical protein n=1 Tax=unclassified Sphingomonas TaxID=196159 RepID=UPI001ACBA49A|nr:MULTISPECIES: hypothetical protein [unclassified Sphingomonas]MBN8850106.1 hypothetical protein [Sphingomonas sp.]